MVRKDLTQLRGGYTLSELVIIIGILSVLFAAGVLIINPVEYVRQGRDHKRVAEISSLEMALGRLVSGGLRGSSLGVASTVYISLIDETSPTCAHQDLPALDAAWQYNCSASEAAARDANGAGWLPVNLVQYNHALLPLDPLNNSSSSFYFYATDGLNGFVVGAMNMESQRYGINGDRDVVSNDGGIVNHALEKGTNRTFHGLPE